MSLFPSNAFANYWKMWNEPDMSLVRQYLDNAVTENFVFCDPNDHHSGRDALEANVRGFRSKYRDALFVMASGFDAHHDRVRYRWDLTIRGKVYVEGLDVATVGAGGLIERIDGFFGDLPPLAVERTAEARSTGHGRGRSEHNAT